MDLCRIIAIHRAQTSLHSIQTSAMFQVTFPMGRQCEPIQEYSIIGNVSPVKQQYPNGCSTVRASMTRWPMDGWVNRILFIILTVHFSFGMQKWTTTLVQNSFHSLISLFWEERTTTTTTTILNPRRQSIDNALVGWLVWVSPRLSRSVSLSRARMHLLGAFSQPCCWRARVSRLHAVFPVNPWHRAGAYIPIGHLLCSTDHLIPHHHYPTLPPVLITRVNKHQPLENINKDRERPLANAHSFWLVPGSPTYTGNAVSECVWNIGCFGVPLLSNRLQHVVIGPLGYPFASL